MAGLGRLLWLLLWDTRERQPGPRGELACVAPAADGPGGVPPWRRAPCRPPWVAAVVLLGALGLFGNLAVAQPWEPPRPATHRSTPAVVLTGLARPLWADAGGVAAVDHLLPGAAARAGSDFLGALPLRPPEPHAVPGRLRGLAPGVALAGLLLGGLQSGLLGEGSSTAVTPALRGTDGGAAAAAGETCRALQGLLAVVLLLWGAGACARADAERVEGELARPAGALRLLATLRRGKLSAGEPTLSGRSSVRSLSGTGPV